MLSEDYFYTDYRPGDPLPIPETAEEEEMVVEKAVFDLRAGKEIHPYLREVIRENNLCPEIEEEEEMARREEEIEEECQLYIDRNEPIPDYILDELPDHIKDTLPEWAIKGEPPKRPPLETRAVPPTPTDINTPYILANPPQQQNIYSRGNQYQEADLPPFPYTPPARSTHTPYQSSWTPPTNDHNPYVPVEPVSPRSTPDIPVQPKPQYTWTPPKEVHNPYKEVKSLKEVVEIRDPIDPHHKF